jgi:hypothetical protein
MITYAERACFRLRHLRLLSRVEAHVARVSDTWANELRCHELVRAVHHVIYVPKTSPMLEREHKRWWQAGGGDLNVVDGHCGPVEHSWIRFSDGVILDAYVPGRLPAVQLVDPLVGTTYRPGSLREDIRQKIVDQLIVEMRG